MLDVVKNKLLQSQRRMAWKYVWIYKTCVHFDLEVSTFRKDPIAGLAYIWITSYESVY